MIKIKYIGRCSEVSIPSLKLYNLKRNVEVDVPDEAADALKGRKDFEIGGAVRQVEDVPETIDASNEEDE